MEIYRSDSRFSPDLYLFPLRDYRNQDVPGLYIGIRSPGISVHNDVAHTITSTIETERSSVLQVTGLSVEMSQVHRSDLRKSSGRAGS